MLPIEPTCFPALDAFLAGRIAESNIAITENREVKDIALQIKDRSSLIIAGISGFIWAGTCRINNLWVHPTHRNLGFGRRLMGAAEAQARELGCSQIVLSSHSFQAPQFYEKLGFVRVAEIVDFPQGHSDMVFLKKLPNQNIA